VFNGQVIGRSGREQLSDRSNVSITPKKNTTLQVLKLMVAESAFRKEKQGTPMN
jgi:hypothetical protein